MRVPVIPFAAVLLGGCTFYALEPVQRAERYPPPPPQVVIADPVGLTVAEGGVGTAPVQIPGLLDLANLGILAGGTVLTTILAGPIPP
jgi:hypothetical protein